MIALSVDPLGSCNNAITISAFVAGPAAVWDSVGVCASVRVVIRLGFAALVDSFFFVIRHLFFPSVFDAPFFRRDDYSLLLLVEVKSTEHAC
jgi:hypothetical protein